MSDETNGAPTDCVDGARFGVSRVDQTTEVTIELFAAVTDDRRAAWREVEPSVTSNRRMRDNHVMNFFWIPAAASPLAAHSRIHIGRSVRGWSFMFRGYRDPDLPFYKGTDTQMLRRYVDGEGSMALEVTTWNQWKALLSRGGEIRNEEDVKVSFDSLRSMIETQGHPTAVFRGRPVRNYVIEVRTELARHGQAEVGNEMLYWLDPQGYGFTIVHPG